MPVFKCNFCNKFETNDTKNYVSHLKSAHNSFKLNLRCCICNKQLNSYDGLKSHLNKCTFNLPKTQEVCDELPADLNNLRIEPEGNKILFVLLFTI